MRASLNSIISKLKKEELITVDPLTSPVLSKDRDLLMDQDQIETEQQWISEMDQNEMDNMSEEDIKSKYIQAAEQRCE